MHALTRACGVQWVSTSYIGVFVMRTMRVLKRATGATATDAVNYALKAGWQPDQIRKHGNAAVRKALGANAGVAQVQVQYTPEPTTRKRGKTRRVVPKVRGTVRLPLDREM